jgi:hypothetical protein
MEYLELKNSINTKENVKERSKHRKAYAETDSRDAPPTQTPSSKICIWVKNLNEHPLET